MRVYIYIHIYTLRSPITKNLCWPTHTHDNVSLPRLRPWRDCGGGTRGVFDLHGYGGIPTLPTCRWACFFPAMAQRPGDVMGIKAYKMVVE